MFRRLVLLPVIASLAALALAMMTDQRGFEELAERAAIADQANVPGTRCPLSREYIDQADITLLSICVIHGLAAYEAAQRYPASAAKVFAVYGEDETFRKVLDQYGPEVIPVVASYVENGSWEFQIRQVAAETWQAIWAGQKPKWELGTLTGEQIGLIAIHQIAVRGHEMLAEFEIVNGIAKQKPVTWFILGSKDLLLGGVGDVEKILVRGERLPTWGEAGSAVLDLTIVGGSLGLLEKTTRVGGSVGKSTGRLVAEGVYEGIRGVVKTSKRIAPYRHCLCRDYAARAHCICGRVDCRAAWSASVCRRLCGLFHWYPRRRRAILRGARFYRLFALRLRLLHLRSGWRR